MDNAVAMKSIEPIIDKTALVEIALRPDILLGMPHLAPDGLSETWLLKELAHRHWLMLGRLMGMQDAGFRASDGSDAYAAICASSIENARFDLVGANSILSIHTELLPVSRTQVASRHQLIGDGIPIGTVELISTFVRRSDGDSNRSIVRLALPGLPPPHAIAANSLAASAAAIRNRRVDQYRGHALKTDAALQRFAFTPSVAQEFNGAGLMYFVHFQSILDRAMEHWFPNARQRPVAWREIFYVGNLDRGEGLVISLMSVSQDGKSAHCTAERDDGAIIAHMFFGMG